MSPFHPVAGDRLRIDRVIVVTFAILRRGWMVILPLAILLEWAPAGLLDVVASYVAPQLKRAPYLAGVLSFGAWLVFPLADIAVVMTALGILRGKPISFGAALLAAAGLYPVVFVLDFLQNLIGLAQPWLPAPVTVPWIGVAASLVNVIYGLASAALLLPSLAVAGEERLGVRGALTRSAALTHGDRLRVAIFAAMLLVLQELFAPLIQALILGLAGRGDVAAWLSLAPGALIFAFASTSQASLYWELARLRDGAAPADVEQVFG